MGLKLYSGSVLICSILLESDNSSVVISAMMLRAFALVTLAQFAGATELTKDSWDSAVAGKSVFVKFLAPW